MARHARTQAIIDAALVVLNDHHPMTVRQVYYQLVSRQGLKNSLSEYKRTSNALVAARKDGSIPWDWIEDRLRRPRAVLMWADPQTFGEAAPSWYRRNVWATQPHYVECWLEKDALSGIFEDVLDPFGVTLNVGRGFDGWASIHEASERYGDGDGVTVLYFGDFDPSGEEMVRSLAERLGHFDCRPEIIKIALTRDDIDRYSLPPDLTKASDTRQRKFAERHGDISAELDALPVHVLQERIRAEVAARMDLGALNDVHDQGEADRARLVEALREVTL